MQTVGNVREWAGYGTSEVYYESLGDELDGGERNLSWNQTKNQGPRTARSKYHLDDRYTKLRRSTSQALPYLPSPLAHLTRTRRHYRRQMLVNTTWRRMTHLRQQCGRCTPRTKVNLTHAQRTENLTWRMIALALKKEKK